MKNLTLEKIIFQAIKEIIYNFSKTYAYEKVFVFMLEISPNPTFFYINIGVEADIQGKPDNNHLIYFANSSDWLYAYQQKILAPNFYKNFKKWQEKNIMDISYNAMLNLYKKILTECEKKGFFTALAVTDYFQIIIKEEDDIVFYIEKTQNYLPSPMPLPNKQPTISLPYNKSLENLIYQDIENLENWQVYGDWLQIQGDIRGNIIHLSIAYQSLYPKFNLINFNELLQQPYAWPESDKTILQALQVLYKQKWQFLPEQVAKEIFRNTGVYLQWYLGFIYSIEVDYKYYKNIKSLSNLLTSDATIFLYSLSFLDIPKETINSLFSLKTYISVKKLYISSPLDSTINLNKNFPHLTHLSITSASSLLHSNLIFLSLNTEYFPKKIVLPKLKHIELSFYQANRIHFPEYFYKNLSQTNLPRLKKLTIDTLKHALFDAITVLNHCTIIKQIETLIIKSDIDIENIDLYIKVLTSYKALKKLIIEVLHLDMHYNHYKTKLEKGVAEVLNKEIEVRFEVNQ